MISEIELRELVSNEEATIWSITETLNCSKNTVSKYIKKYGILTRKGFYNKPGKKVGRSKGFKMSEHQKQLMSVRFKGENNPFYGKNHSLETRQKMSRNHADFSGAKNPFLKAILTYPTKHEEHKKRCQERWDEKDYNYRKKFGKDRQAGYKDINGTFWARVKSNAKTRSIPLEVDISDAWDVLNQQGKKCALTGIDLIFEVTLGETTASLDRIDSKIGYTKDNIQWLHKKINLMKGTLSQEEFINFCKKVSDHEQAIKPN